MDRADREQRLVVTEVRDATGPDCNCSFGASLFQEQLPDNSWQIRFAPFSTGSGGNLNYLHRVSITMADVPEPKTWAMLITGFGLVGAAARRTRIPAP